MHTSYQPLKKAPQVATTYKEIVAVYDHHLPDYFNALTPQERVMIYYLFRASLPGNKIAADQSHRDAIILQEVCEYIIRHEDILKKAKIYVQERRFFTRSPNIPYIFVDKSFSIFYA